MAKTYAPQLARLLQHVQRYYVKHQAKIDPVLSAQQKTDITAIQASIASSWAGVQTVEQP